MASLILCDACFSLKAQTQEQSDRYLVLCTVGLRATLLIDMAKCKYTLKI